jgi:hypothetical protein
MALVSAGLFLLSWAGASDTYPITVKQSNVEPGGQDCVNGEWHLIINQIDDELLAPNSVYVTFSDGHTHTYGLTKFTGKTAHYTIYDHLTSTLITATTDIYNGWSGQFVVSHAPCTSPPCEEEVCDTPSPTPTPTPVPSPTPTPTATSTPPPPTPIGTVTPVSSSITTTLVPPSLPLGLPDTGGEPGK